METCMFNNISLVFIILIFTSVTLISIGKLCLIIGTIKGVANFGVFAYTYLSMKAIFTSLAKIHIILLLNIRKKTVCHVFF